MSSTADPSWSFLSPAAAGWWLISGMRGRVRRLVASNHLMTTGAEPVGVVLEVITDVAHILQAAETEVLLLVAEAHQRGASWAEIALRLDRTKQSVHQRYQAKIYSRRTTDLLAADLAEGLVRAGQLSRGEASAAIVKEARALLRARSRFTVS